MATGVAWSDEVWPKSYADGVTRKLGRALANLVTAPLELACKPSLVGERDGGVAKWTIGLVQGLWAFGMREAAGIAELVTFAVPIPDARFQPLVRPEFVYAHGAWSPDE